MKKSSLPSPRSDQAGWMRALRRASALRTTQHSTDYTDLCYALKGSEAPACFQALIDSVRTKNDHGVYEATFNAVWRFPLKTRARYLAAALPGFVRRADHTGQVERMLIGMTSGKEAVVFAGHVKALPPAKRRVVLLAFKRWARHEEELEGFLHEYFGLAPRPVGVLTVPVEWPARYKLAVERHLSGKLELRENWERWPRRDMALFVAHLVTVDDLGPLWKTIGVLLNPLSTFAGGQQDVFIDHLAKLPPARRARTLKNLRRINTGPQGGMFHGMLWPLVEARLVKRKKK